MECRKKEVRKFPRLSPTLLGTILWLGIVLIGQTGLHSAQVAENSGVNFTGSSYGVNSSALPPDANGAIGPRHFMEFINGTVAVYNKTNGVKVQRKTDIKFWSDSGLIISPDSAVTDARVIYDPQSQRWFATMVDFDATAADPTLEANDFLLAVSATSDPTGTWHGFLFQADPDTGDFADFPTLGVDAQGVYISGDMFSGQTSPVGPALVAIPKADLLLATPTITNRIWFGVMDYAVRGQVLQPVSCFDGSETGALLSVENIGMASSFYSNLVTFAVENVTSNTNASLTDATWIPVAPYMVPDNSDFGSPLLTPLQPDGTSQLQANDARFCAKVYAVKGVIYAVHNTEYNGHLAIRWYRINAATHALLEMGTITYQDLDLFFPSIAVNTNGVIVIGCNGSSGSSFVSSYAFVGAVNGGTTTFDGPYLLQSGAVSYHGDDELEASLLDMPAFSRWGDYSATSVDPSDPNIFWTIQIYPSDTDVWSTQITQINTARPAVSLAKAGSDAVVSWPVTTFAFQLQSNTNATANAWTTIASSSYSTNNGRILYQEPFSAGSKLFRLRY